MPVTAGNTVDAIVLYYNLAGNNNNTNAAQYRSHNPWQTAKRFCHDLAVTHTGQVASVTTIDDSVFVLHLTPVSLQQGLAATATLLLGDLATAIAPAAIGDRLVAVVPVAGQLQEIVHHTP